MKAQPPDDGLRDMLEKERRVSGVNIIYTEPSALDSDARRQRCELWCCHFNVLGVVLLVQIYSKCLRRICRGFQ